MIQRILEQQSPICSTLLELKRLDLLPKDEEFDVLEELVSVLQPFKEVTAQVSAEVYVTSSSVHPLLGHLTESALKIEPTNSVAVQRMKSEMKNNLQSRYRNESTTRLLNHACFVDPRFKTMPFLDTSKRKSLHDDIVGEMESHMLLSATDCTAAEPEDSESTDAELPAKKKPKTLLGQLLGDMFSQKDNNRPLSIKQKAELELQHYVDEASPALDANPLAWWKEHNHRFPNIANIAIKLLCIPATSTPSEKLFSTAGQIINYKRACLDPDNVDMLCFLAEKFTLIFNYHYIS